MKKTLLCLLVAGAMAPAAFGQLAVKQGVLSDVKAVTAPGERYEYPRWSPDGSKISYTREGFEGLYVMSADGAEARQLSNDLGAGYQHKWSPDSREILFRSTRPVQSEEAPRLHTIKAVTLNGAVTRMSDEAYPLQPASYRMVPAGRAVYAEGVRMTAAAEAVPMDMRRARTFNAAATTNVSFITDGVKLYIIDAEGNKSVLNDAPSFNPVISPDGKMVAFDEGDDITVMNLDGTGKKKVAEGFNPSWASNSQLVYEKTTDDGHVYTAGELCIVDINTGAWKMITSTNNRIEMNPCVSPDGTKLVFTDFMTGQLYTAELR